MLLSKNLEDDIEGADFLAKISLEIYNFFIMKFLFNLDDIQKSFLITTLFVIGISSINTGSINIDPYHF